MINCPHCGASHYVYHYSMTTALGWQQEYKDGMLINNNPNVSTSYCTCCECNHDFFYTEQYGEVQEIVDQGEHPEIPTLKMPLVSSEEEQTTVSSDNLMYEPGPTNLWKTFVSTEEFKELSNKIDRLTKMVESLWEWNTHDSLN